MASIVDVAREAGAWVHVEGAFGLWAGAAPALRHLVPGVDSADSWATARTCWLSGTTWQGRAAMRISVSNWQTTDDDVERSAEAILRVSRRR